MKYLLFTILILAVIGCRKDKVEEIKCIEERSFSVDVLPILTNNCSTSGCHDSDGQSGGYVFETHEQIDQHAIIILAAMKHETIPLMPQDAPKLADSLTNVFECWVNQGKLDN